MDGWMDEWMNELMNGCMKKKPKKTTADVLKNINNVASCGKTIKTNLSHNKLKEKKKNLTRKPT